MGQWNGDGNGRGPAAAATEPVELAVLHQIPGRMRLSLPLDVVRGDPRYLEIALAHCPAVWEVSTNMVTRNSLVIYDPAEVAPCRVARLSLPGRTDDRAPARRIAACLGHGREHRRNLRRGRAWHRRRDRISRQDRTGCQRRSPGRRVQRSCRALRAASVAGEMRLYRRQFRHRDP